VRTCGLDNPTCWAAWAATRRLSPVIILSETPRRSRWPIVSTIPGLGGSKSTRKPKKVMSTSCSLVMRESDPTSRYATPVCEGPGY